MAAVIVLWRFTGARSFSGTGEVRAQKAVFLLVPSSETRTRTPIPQTRKHLRDSRSPGGVVTATRRSRDSASRCQCPVPRTGAGPNPGVVSRRLAPRRAVWKVSRNRPICTSSPSTNTAVSTGLRLR